MGWRPKCPTSAHSASAPVTTRTTAPVATRAMRGCPPTKASAYVGESPSSMPGCTTTSRSPARARAANHTSVTGPNSDPARPVPKRWAANSRVRTTAATGTTTWPRDGAATPRPSTAESTLMAKVMIGSPQNSDTPTTPSRSSRPGWRLRR